MRSIKINEIRRRKILHRFNFCREHRAQMQSLKIKVDLSYISL